MQDFYSLNDNTDFSTPNSIGNINTPSLEELYQQGLRLNTKLNDPFDPDYGYNPSGHTVGFDWVVNRYPALKNGITAAREHGVSDERIADAIESRLSQLDFYAKPDTINQRLGRTEQSMRDDAAYRLVKEFDALKKAFPEKSNEDIFNAVELASRYDVGVSPVALLKNNELFNAFLRGKKVRESLGESVLRGGKNYWTLNTNGEFGRQFIMGLITRDELFKKVEDNSKNFIDEPAVSTFWNDLGAGVSGILTQGYKNAGKGILAGGAVAIPFGAAGSFFGMAKPMAKAGFKAGYYGTMAWELFEDQAGNDVYELLKMTDENGQPLDENVARVTACITGAVTVATELAAYKYLLNLIPGGDKLKALLGIDRQHVINAVRTNPVLRDTFSRIAVDMSKGIGVSTFNNIIEAINTDLKIPLAQAFSDQPFPQFDWRKWAGDTFEHVYDTAVSSIRDFTGSALLSFLFDPRQTNIWRVAKWTKDFNQNIREISQRTGLTVQEAERAVAEHMRDEQIAQANKPILENTKSDVNPDNETGISTKDIITDEERFQPESTTVTTPAETENHPNFVYIPAEPFRGFAKTNPDFKGLEAFRAGDEIALTPENFDKLKNDENGKAFVNSINDDIRFGADGSTFADVTLNAVNTDQNEAEIFHSQENKKLYDNITTNLVQSGFSAEEADILGRIAQTVNTVSIATDGVSMLPIAIENSDNNSGFSRINTDYDIHNPETWPNKELAQKYSELSAQAKLPDIVQSTKDILEIISGKKPALGEDLTAKSRELFKSLNEETPDNLTASMRDILREELSEYRTEIENSGIDVLDSLAALQLDPLRYEINSEFPRGKKRNPDFSYSFGLQGIHSKIDFAVDGIDLKARIHTSGKDNPLIFTVKNFRTANLAQVLSDITSGKTLAGVPVNDTPLAGNINDAFSAVWRELDLPAVNTFHDDFNVDNAPAENVHLDVQKPDTVKGDIPIEIITSPTDTSRMPLEARQSLYRDESAWKNTVEEYLTNPDVSTKSRKEVTVMNTPLVLTLVGAKQLPLKINNGKLQLILKNHDTMTPDILMALPRAMSDPIAIFNSDTTDNGLVMLLDMKDANGASILAAVHLDQRGNINKLASSYPQANKKGVPRNQWFREQIQKSMADGSPVYINRTKAAQWETETGVPLMQEGDIYTHTEDDLIRLWNLPEQKGFYYTDPETGLPMGEAFERGGRGVIRFFKSAMDRAIHRASKFLTAIHELGHNMFFTLQMRARTGSLQSLQDMNTLIQRAGVTVEAFKSNIDGAREKVNEFVADSWLTYVTTGNAPKGLEKVFKRARDFILQTYQNFESQLRIKTIDDDVRAVFDRLLTIPGGADSSVADFAISDMRVSKQITEYQRLIDEENRKIAEREHTAQEAYNNPDAFQIDTDTANLVDEYINLNDYREILRDELNAEQEHAREILAAIKSTGLHVSKADVITYFGQENLDTFYKLWRGRGVYKATDTPMADQLADALANLGYFQEDATDAFGQGHGNVQALMDWLMNFDKDILNRNIEDAPPNIPVNTNSINAFLAAEGVDGTVDYLHKRLKLINAALNGNSELTSQQIEAFTSEISEINDWLKRLDKDFDDGIKPPKRKKPAISRTDLRQGIMTGYTLGREDEREFARLHEKNALDTLSMRSQERIDALRNARTADKEKYQQRLQTILQRVNDRHNSKLQKQRLQAQRRINMFTKRINNLKNFIARSAERRNIKRMVKSILRMSKAKSVSWGKLKEIQSLLDNYNLSTHGIKHRDLIREFIGILNNEGEQYDQDFADEFAETHEITQQDVDDFNSKIHLEDLTLAQVQDLFNKVKQIFRQGREQFILWKNERDNRRDNMRKSMTDDLSSVKGGEVRVVKGSQDLEKQNTTLESYWNSIHTPGRFLRKLGENFRYIFEDGFTERRAEAFKWIFTREEGFKKALEDNNVTIKQLNENAITVDGQKFTWSQALGVYLGMQNEKHRDAIIYGNFMANASNPLKPYHSETEAIAAIGKIIQTVKNNPNMKAVADWILSDFDTHFDRINNANIANFNRGMNREKNYSPMFRLQLQTGQGINSTEIENMTINADKPQLLSDVADNFTHERQNIDHDHQQPVNLDMLNVWFKAMYMQEFNAALGGYAADIRSALLRDGEGGSIQQMIKQNLGTDYWNNLIGIYNNSINDNFTQKLDAAEKIARMLIRARSTAYIAFNPSVIAAQFSSYVTALPYTGWGHLLQSLNKALEGGQQFIENVHQIAPELRFSAGDPVDREYAISLNRENLSSNNRLINAALQNDYIRGGLDLYRRGIAAGYKGVQLVDNWTKSIVFDAAYSKYIDDGLSHEEAVRLANRVLRDTQPASSNREKAPITRGSYLKQLFFTQFMNSLIPIVNMTFVDTAYNLTHGGWNTVKDTGFRLFAAALTLGLAGFTKDLLNGRLPSDRERADGSVDDWPSWFGNTELGGLLNTIPFLNRFLDIASPYIGIRHLRQDNPITEPLERIARGIQLFGKYEGERNSEAWGQIIHGMALIGAPIPFSGIKQFMRLVGLLDNDRD